MPKWPRWVRSSNRTGAWSIRLTHPNGTIEVVMAIRSILAALVAFMLAANAAQAERAKSGVDKSGTEKSGTDKPAARDSATIQDCIKSAGGGQLEQERCIGIVADACVKDNNAMSTADLVACAAREH